MHARFFLVAEPRLTGFKLRKDGEKWEEDFHTIPQAVLYVRSLPDHDGEVIVLNSSGKEISHIHIEERVESDYGGEQHRHRHRHVHVHSTKPRRRRRRLRPWLRWLIIALLVVGIILFLLGRAPV